MISPKKSPGSPRRGHSNGGVPTKSHFGVSYGNTAAIKAYENAGFKIEGRQRSQIYEGGAYVDKILMGLLREDLPA